MTESERISLVLIEDDRGVVDFLERGLANEGYDVTVFGDGDSALNADREVYRNAGVVLLDLSLPGRSGNQVLAQLRGTYPRLPIVVVTARHRVADKVELFDAGANDYVTKPFDMAELLARIRAAMRSASSAPTARRVLGDLTLDLYQKSAQRGGRRLELAPREWALLEYLSRNAHEILPRERILADVWGIDFGTSSNVVDVYVGYLRRKLDLPGEAIMLETVRGRGYRFIP